MILRLLRHNKRTTLVKVYNKMKTKKSNIENIVIIFQEVVTIL